MATEAKQNKICSFDGRVNAEPKVKGQLDVRTLKQANEFSIVFSDGKGIKGKLLAIDNFNLLVTSQNKEILIPKHSVKYILLDSNALEVKNGSGNKGRKRPSQLS